MKKLFVLMMILSVTLLASVIRDGTLQARSDGTNVTIQWGSADESGVSGYEVERRSGTSGDFLSIGTREKKGSNSYYEYIDQTAFKATGTIYQYRIKISMIDGNAEYTKIITVSHNVSSVKRTWGSLKAMFR